MQNRRKIYLDFCELLDLEISSGQPIVLLHLILGALCQ